MFGDVEIVCDLDTYHHTITCTCETDVSANTVVTQ